MVILVLLLELKFGGFFHELYYDYFLFIERFLLLCTVVMEIKTDSNDGSLILIKQGAEAVS